MAYVVATVDPSELRKLKNAAKMLRAIPGVLQSTVKYALSDTVDDLHLRATREMDAVFDRPTPYMKRGIKKIKPGMGSAGRPAMRQGGFSGPKVTSGQAGIYFEEFGGSTSPADVIRPHVKGGGRHMKASEKRLQAYARHKSYLMPTKNMPRDQYGNVAGSRMSQILFELNTFDSARNDPSKKKRVRRKTREYFIYKPARAGYPVGIAERTSERSFRLLFRFTKRPQYKRRYAFHEFSNRQAMASLPRHFVRVFRRQAMKAGLFA
jgi:hypothetical protein